MSVPWPSPTNPLTSCLFEPRRHQSSNIAAAGNEEVAGEWSRCDHSASLDEPLNDGASEMLPAELIEVYDSYFYNDDHSLDLADDDTLWEGHRGEEGYGDKVKKAERIHKDKWWDCTHPQVATEAPSTSSKSSCSPSTISLPSPLLAQRVAVRPGSRDTPDVRCRQRDELCKGTLRPLPPKKRSPSGPLPPIPANSARDSIGNVTAISSTSSPTNTPKLLPMSMGSMPANVRTTWVTEPLSHWSLDSENEKKKTSKRCPNASHSPNDSRSPNASHSPHASSSPNMSCSPKTCHQCKGQQAHSRQTTAAMGVQKSLAAEAGPSSNGHSLFSGRWKGLHQRMKSMPNLRRRSSTQQSSSGARPTPPPVALPLPHFPPPLNLSFNSPPASPRRPGPTNETVSRERKVRQPKFDLWPSKGLAFSQSPVPEQRNTKQSRDTPKAEVTSPWRHARERAVHPSVT